MNGPPSHILVVEDDADVREITELLLQRAGYLVTTATDGSAGLAAALDAAFDLAVVDVAMPGMDGMRLTRHLRQLGVPVILLTARDLPSDIINGLDAGADDYLTKPFDAAVLAARIRAVLRRPGRELPKVEQVGPVAIDRSAMAVAVHGEPVGLSETEFRLLALLLDHRGYVVSRTELQDDIWPDLDDDSRVIDTTIQRLRKRLGVDVIRTIRGIGYIIDRP